MSRRPRRNHLPAFKDKVALEVAKEEMITSGLAQKYDGLTQSDYGLEKTTTGLSYRDV